MPLVQHLSGKIGTVMVVDCMLTASAGPHSSEYNSSCCLLSAALPPASIASHLTRTCQRQKQKHSLADSTSPACHNLHRHVISTPQPFTHSLDAQAEQCAIPLARSQGQQRIDAPHALASRVPLHCRHRSQLRFTSVRSTASTSLAARLRCTTTARA